METGWRHSFTGSDEACGGTIARGGYTGQNSNFTNTITWEDNNNNNISNISTHHNWNNHAATSNNIQPEANADHALLFRSDKLTQHKHCMPDGHMMCLKLGKRHYCQSHHVTAAAANRGRPPPPYQVMAIAAAEVVRCKVEGCHVALDNAKEYYKKHKVCEIHSKAPNVVVLGQQQRFCQQCSRFHRVSEFDAAKRSCRRRLKGHNQRRRKGTYYNRNFLHYHEYNPTMEQHRLQPLSASFPHLKPRNAFSLLSSQTTEPLISSSDSSLRCSAALYELIAANRANFVVGHEFLNQNTSHQSVIENTMQTLQADHNQIWDRFSDVNHATVYLDIMEAPELDFGLLSMKEKSKGPEERIDYCWSAFGGANVL